MGNISGTISNATTSALALSNLILVTPKSGQAIQPQNGAVNNGSPMQVPPSLLFNYQGEQTVTLECDVTDHFVEDNTAIQDQVALKPIIVTTQGFIGELTDIAPRSLEALKEVANKLTVLGAYTPVLSATAILAYNEAQFLYSTVANAATAAVAAWSSISGGNSQIQTKQQVFFNQLIGYQQGRTLFTVQTPWASFENMIIMRLRAVQDEKTNVITDFEIMFKQMRFAQTLVAPTFDSSNAQGRSANQGASLVDLGTSTPPLSTESFLSQVA